jgi:Flagellar hook capping protein
VNYAAVSAVNAARTVSATWESTAQQREKSSTASEALDEMFGKDVFLRLLTTQLRYQDPFKPIEDQDFIAQMAQFVALEQTQNLTRQLELFMAEQRATNRMAQATALLGRQVEVKGENGTYTGTVEAVRLIQGVPYLVVSDALFDVGDVVKVLS